MNSRTSLYIGTFDPWTNGHHDVLRASLALFDEVIVAILTNPDKHPMFSVAERRGMIQAAAHADPEIDVERLQIIDQPERLAVEVAAELGAGWLIRGLRLSLEYEAELGVCLVNAVLAEEIQTVYIPSRQENLHVSSTAVRTQIKFGRLDGVGRFVPRAVLEDIEDILAQRAEEG